MARVIMFAAAGCVAVVVLIAAAAGGVVAALFGTSGQDPSCAAATVTLQPAARDPAPEGPAARGPAPEGPAGLTAEQARNAAVIVAVGRRLGVPVRGWVVAVATALQESGLINSGTATNADSLGLFQQRPSQGWGTLAQIMEPAYASAAFYTALHRVPHWQTLPLTVAAQTVQRSAYPDAYADDEPRAAAIVASYTGGVVCDGGDGRPGPGCRCRPGSRCRPTPRRLWWSRSGGRWPSAGRRTRSAGTAPRPGLASLPTRATVRRW